MYVIMRPDHVERLRQKRVFFTLDGSNRFGDGHPVVFEQDTAVEPYSALLGGMQIPTIGAFSYSHSELPSPMRIGRYCSISWGIRVMAFNHPVEFVSTSSFSSDSSFIIFRQSLQDSGLSEIPFHASRPHRPNRNETPVVGHDVWIGQDVLLARGIELGIGSVVAAGSVVTRSVPPYAIVGGNPAQIIRFRFDEATIGRMLESRWWTYKLPDIGVMRYDDPNTFLDQLHEAVQHGGLVPFEPEAVLLREVFEEG